MRMAIKRQTCRGVQTKGNEPTMTSRLRIILPAAFALASVLLLPTAARAQALGVHGGATYSEYKFETPSIATEGLWGGTGGVFVTLGGRGLFGGMVDAIWARLGT